MAGRMIQNNFGAGCLSPSLYAASDLKAYYNGFASGENFVVTKERTLRKRRGVTTSGVGFDTYFQIIIPYAFDRKEGGFAIISSGTAYLYKKGSSVAFSQVATCAIPSGWSYGSIANVQHKQIGDEVWVTGGNKTLILTVGDFDTTPSLSARLWEPAGIPDNIECRGEKNVTPTDETWLGWTYKRSTTSSLTKEFSYAIVGEKDGVRSPMSKATFKWQKSWVAGATITFSFTCRKSDRDKYDTVILAKRLGANFGQVSTIYTSDTPDYMYTSDWVETDDIEQAAYLQWRMVDDNISPGESVYEQTNVLGDSFGNALCVDCFQQRRVFANASNEDGDFPMTLWFSEVGNLDNFYANRPANDSDAFSPTIASTGPAFIRWIVAYQEMLILFTDGGIFSVGFAQTSGFSASSCRITRVSNLGVAPDIQPVVTDAGVVFVGADQKTLYTAAYDLQENMLKPVNRSVLVEHLTRTAKITSMALQAFPDNVVWLSLENGRFATFTFERDQEIFAWSDGYIPNTSVRKVVSLGTVTEDSGSRTYSDIALIVTRNSETRVAIFSNRFYDSVNGTPTNVKATLTTLRPESQERTIIGREKNVKDVLLRLYETGGISVKPTNGGAAIPLIAAKLPTGSLYTGDVKVVPRGLIDDGGQMTYVSDNDQPCEILAILTTLEVAQ